ncbi:Trs120-domain-containing protein [Backusella circina FSU 941]|nr:Trs120-domain-containing protein [Backusella circina FSU 941]
MELAQDITSICRVRVLLIPVSPIKKSVFYKYVELVKTFHLVRLGDVTPDLKQGSSAMFSSQVFQEGQLHFQFQTHWTREHAELEDFQPHRRIFGVIGIMDCQEWKDKDLSEGYKQFAEGLDKYPTAVATRCFAFDPTETQADDTKGLIMIPNVGNMSFYMSTMICDFTSEILNQFALIAGRIEKLNVLESPIPTSTHVPTRSKPSNRQSSPPSLVSSPHTNSNYKRSSLSLQTTNSSGPMPQPSISRNQSTTAGENMKSKKRTPGRVKKLLGDFYLLAGRLPDAVNHYDQAIEMGRLTSDFLWLASAMEGWICATLLLEFLQADVGHIVSRHPPASSPSSSSSTIKDGEQTQAPPRSTLVVVIQNYRTIITNYTKVISTASFPAPDLVYAEACLKIARFLATAYITDQWNETLPLLIQGAFPHQHVLTNKRRKNGLARYDIAIWITKIWEIQISELSLLDQIHLATHMSTVYSAIGYHRKGAWLLHESIEHMLPLIIQHRRTGLSKDAHSKSEHDMGVLELLKRICEVYGIGERNVHDGGTLEVMQEDSMLLGEPKVNGGVRGAAAKETVRFGWPELQIDILKQCISVAEALIDNGARLYYTTVLLKNLYRYISKAEQIRLATTIQSLVSRPNQLESINYWGVNIVSNIEAKKPISRKAVYEHPIKSEIIKTEIPNDPFIYNPFAQKKKDTKAMVLVKDETCDFKVTLVNPFGFDLDLQSIMLSTSGIAFNAISTAVTIPANATVHVLLTGIPEETGELTIRGCLIRIIGFSEQEFLVDSEVKKDSEMNDDFIKIKKQGLKAIKTNRKRETSSEMRPIQFYQLSVIDDQPLLKIRKTSLLHGAVMLFEGEMTFITMELENIGNIAVDFITLSFTDSTTIQPINPDLSEEEQYELELYTKGTRVFSWEGTSERTSSDFIGKKIWLPPGEAIEIKVKVYGKRDCRGGTIQVDYGYLDRAVKDIFDTEKPNMFYTRQLYLNVMITVYQNLDPFNWDIVYLRHSIPASKQALEHAIENIRSHNKGSQPIEDLLLITQSIDLENQELNEFCLVTLDVRNSWTTPFEVDFTMDNEDDKPGFKIRILPGSTTRVILPLKRLFLSPEACKEPIPSFDPNKQFVVSQGPKMSEEQQQARLQMFWYREQLLNRIKANWRCSATGRSGILNLRPSSRLSALQLAILKKEDIEFFIDVKNALKISRRRLSCECGTRVVLNITIRNRFSHPVKLILRIQPVQSYNDGLKEYDLSNKMLLEGTEQLVLPEIPADATSDILEFPIFFLSRGQFEILYHAEDVHTRKIHYDHEWTIVDVLEKAI